MAGRRTVSPLQPEDGLVPPHETWFEHCGDSGCLSCERLRHAVAAAEEAKNLAVVEHHDRVLRTLMLIHASMTDAGKHFEGCWRSHPECAMGEAVRLVRGLDPAH